MSRQPLHALDMYLFGIFLYEVFNGRVSKVSEIKQKGRIPKIKMSQYNRLLSTPSDRPTASAFITDNSLFFNNNYTSACLFLENITLKDSYEKDRFFQKLSCQLEEFPVSLCKHKLLPQLIDALDYGSANSRVLGPLLKIGKMLSAEEYRQVVLPSVKTWFSSNDRSLRISLLQNMEHFAEHLTPSLVNENIFPSLLNGFSDTSPTLRELTVKSILHLAPKMNEHLLNNDLLRIFAKLQLDPEKGIRTNTTICLGKISPFLSESTRKKILIPAFARALRDPFDAARLAGVMSLTATLSSYDDNDIATKILPSLCLLTIDPSLQVRKHAFAGIKAYLKRLERGLCGTSKHTQELPKPDNSLSTSLLGTWGTSVLAGVTKKIVGEGGSNPTSPDAQVSNKVVVNLDNVSEEGSPSSLQPNDSTLPKGSDHWGEWDTDAWEDNYVHVGTLKNSETIDSDAIDHRNSRTQKQNDCSAGEATSDAEHMEAGLYFSCFLIKSRQEMIGRIFWTKQMMIYLTA